MRDETKFVVFQIVYNHWIGSEIQLKRRTFFKNLDQILKKKKIYHRLLYLHEILYGNIPQPLSDEIEELFTEFMTLYHYLSETCPYFECLIH